MKGHKKRRRGGVKWPKWPPQDVAEKEPLGNVIVAQTGKGGGGEAHHEDDLFLDVLEEQFTIMQRPPTREDFLILVEALQAAGYHQDALEGLEIAEAMEDIPTPLVEAKLGLARIQSLQALGEVEIVQRELPQIQGLLNKMVELPGI